MNALRQMISRVKRAGTRRRATVTTVSMGRTRVFTAWDVGDDTFIFENDIARHLGERPSSLVVAKSDLGRRRPGHVFTLTTGNHSVAAFPLLDGRFWKIAHLSSARRGDVLTHAILCSNVIDGVLETSQRDVPSKRLYAYDAWLRGGCGLSLADVIMGDRNELTLAHYRERGEEWRVKPLAWTAAGMSCALAAAKKRIATRLNYYHSSRGVHFLTFAEFARFATLAETEPEEFVKGLKELVSVYEGNRYSFTRLPKYRGHHEIELFGLQRGVALERIVPELDKLMEAITLARTGQLGVIQKTQEILELYRSLLSQPEYADERDPAFIRALYMHVTGEIYAIAGEGATPAFDDRRTALPGGTFVEGRAHMHPGADDRTEVLLSNLRGLMSKDEVVLYANVYELREDDAMPVGQGRTREIVYKTNRCPVEVSLIEKRLSSARRGYGSYMLARVGALKSLGITLSNGYRLLRRRATNGRRPVDFYIRERCEGEPIATIPKSYFCGSDDSRGEDPEVVLGLATLMGDAAAQNLAMKKFDPKTETPLFGVGKEIYGFEYDIIRQRVVPKSVATCSVRGSFGWKDLSFTDENLSAIASYYMSFYAHALKAFAREHSLSMAEMAEAFLKGFEYRTHALAWHLSWMRDQFESFATGLPPGFGFARKWAFVMWSLERQERRMPILRRIFLKKVALVEREEASPEPLPPESPTHPSGLQP